MKRPTERRSFGSLDYSIRLDDKIQYKKLLEKAGNNSSIYSTPVGKLFDYDTANANQSRTDKILALAKNANKKSPGNYKFAIF